MAKKDKKIEHEYRRIFDVVEKNSDTIEEYEHTYQDKGLRVLRLYLEEELELREDRLPRRKEKLEKLKSLHCPEIIIKAEEEAIARSEAVISTLKSLLVFSNYADILDNEELVSNEFNAERFLKDAIEAHVNKSCIYCRYSCMHEGKWVCTKDFSELGSEIVLNGVGFQQFAFKKEPCDDFFLDDLSQSDYEFFLDNNQTYGENELKRMNADKTPDGEFYYIDRMALAISNHHKQSLEHGTKKLLKAIFPELSYEEAKKRIIAKKKEQENESRKVNR